MPVWDQEVLRDHGIDDELRNVNSNTFQKAIDQGGVEPEHDYILLILVGDYRTLFWLGLGR